MNNTLTWSTNDVASTETHSYRIAKTGNINRVIYGAKDGYPVFQSSEFDSVEAAKQWAENYNQKHGVAV